MPYTAPHSCQQRHEGRAQCSRTHKCIRNAVDVRRTRTYPPPPLARVLAGQRWTLRYHANSTTQAVSPSKPMRSGRPAHVRMPLDVLYNGRASAATPAPCQFWCACVCGCEPVWCLGSAAAVRAPPLPRHGGIVFGCLELSLPHLPAAGAGLRLVPFAAAARCLPHTRAHARHGHTRTRQLHTRTRCPRREWRPIASIFGAPARP